MAMTKTGVVDGEGEPPAEKQAQAGCARGNCGCRNPAKPTSGGDLMSRMADAVTEKKAGEKTGSVG